MNTKYWDILEYNKIIENLIKYCKTYIGKQKASNLTPIFESDAVDNLLAQTDEAVSLITKKSSIPLAEIPNIDLWLKQIDSFSVLSLKALLEVANFLKIVREVKEYFYSDEDFDISGFNLLSEYFSNLYTNKSAEEIISSIILDENTIADNASNKLYSYNILDNSCNIFSISISSSILRFRILLFISKIVVFMYLIIFLLILVMNKAFKNL